MKIIAPARRPTVGGCLRTIHVFGLASLAILAGVGIFLLAAGPTTLATELESSDMVDMVVAAPAPPEVVRPRPGGALVIGGGGRLPDEVREHFLGLAGGKDAKIVLIPTARSLASDALADVERDLGPWRNLGVASVCLLHTRSRETANDPEFVKPLAEATGVWISGGTQMRLMEAYGDTEVERQLQALLERGGVIGGTSAGAAIMTRVMIASGRTEPVEGRGFGFLPGAVVDQHFLKRNRIKRLTRLLEKHPDLIGFGIDEQTALVVGVRDLTLSVVGNSYVIACVPAADGRPARYEILKKGDNADLAALRKFDPSAPATPPTLDLNELIATAKPGL